MTESRRDEIGVSVSDVFWFLWAWRGIIVFVPILFAVISVVIIAGSSLAQTRYATYLISLRNIENQRYPNGAEFSPRDLMIPEVLAELRSRFDIPSDVNLQDAISVTYDSPLSGSVARKYQQRLAARNLSQAEIDVLNQNYLEELRVVMRSSVRITVDFKALHLDRSTGLALIAELPRLWTSIYTTKYRIFTDRRLADLTVTHTLERLDTTGSVISAIGRIGAMRYGLGTVINDNRLSILRTSEGRGPADLLVDLENFQSIWFNPVKAWTLRSADTTATAYLDELRLNIAEKWRQIKAFDTALEGLAEYQRSGQMERPGQFPAPSSDQAATMQIGDAAFSGIVQLAQQASFTNFVQRVLDDRRDLMIELARLEREQEFAMQGADNIAISPEFLEAAAELLQVLTSQYAQLLQTAEARLSDRAGDLFEPLLGPQIGGDALLSLRNIMIIATTGLAGGLLAVIGILFWMTLRRGRPIAGWAGSKAGPVYDKAPASNLASNLARFRDGFDNRPGKYAKQHDAEPHPT